MNWCSGGPAEHPPWAGVLESPVQEWDTSGKVRTSSQMPVEQSHCLQQNGKIKMQSVFCKTELIPQTHHPLL